MKDLKTGFTDRLTAQQEAKKALLAKFKPKPAAPDPEFEKLAAKRAAEKEALRQQHELAKAEARREKSEKEAARMAADAEAQEAVEAEKRADRKARKQLTKEEQKEKRDARYAARKARRTGEVILNRTSRMLAELGLPFVKPDEKKKNA